MSALCGYSEDLYKQLSWGPVRELGDGSTYRFSPARPGDLERLEAQRQSDLARISLIARTTADYLTETQSVSAVSAQFVPKLLFELQAQEKKSEISGNSDVAQVVLSAFPEPDELTSIEDILSFKHDTETRQRLLELRIWMREMVRAELSPVELEEKVEWLLHEYRRYMELHRLKCRAGTLETIVTTTLEIAENLGKIKWSNAAKALFSVRRRKLALLEAEAAASGREVSYVAWTLEKFASNG